jgi:hypothetical protein
MTGSTNLTSLGDSFSASSAAEELIFRDIIEALFQRAYP